MIRSFSRTLLRAALWLAASWLFYNSTTFAFSNKEVGRYIFQVYFLHGMVSNAIIFFGVLYIFPRNERRWSWTFWWQILLLCLSVTLLESMLDTWLLDYLAIEPDLRLLREIRLTTVMINLVMLALGLAWGLVLDWFHQNSEARDIRQQQMQTELDLLKSRINPHFLFNVLNSIFYMAHKNNDDETADAIAKLSQMMRYMLHEVSDAQVPLQGELTHLENYVAMQRLRLVEAIAVSFEVEGEAAGLSLPPMILLPFVENAFKYGVSNARPTPISIAIKIESKSLELVVDNHIHPSSQGESGGFGLDNVRRRLNLLYPNKHHLQIDNANGRYRVQLTLQTA